MLGTKTTLFNPGLNTISSEMPLSINNILDGIQDQGSNPSAGVQAMANYLVSFVNSFPAKLTWLGEVQNGQNRDVIFANSCRVMIQCVMLQRLQCKS